MMFWHCGTWRACAVSLKRRWQCGHSLREWSTVGGGGGRSRGSMPEASAAVTCRPQSTNRVRGGGIYPWREPITRGRGG
eukprot:5583049-Pyramimonas_sp.AAC.1